MTAATFERQLAQHCSPAISGIKPANIITFPVKEGEKGPGISRLAAGYDRYLKKRDLRFQILCECPGRCLLMVYRPSLLERHLRQPQVREILVREGYDTESLENMVGQLAGRVGRSGSCEFPHEIGLFLGYPVEDVVGFMENRGKNYLYSCYWKVYSDVERAKAWCSQWERVRDGLVKVVDSGVSISEMLCAGVMA